MDPVAIIVTAVTVGALATYAENAPQTVAAAYQLLVGLFARKYAQNHSLLAALSALAQRPDSQPQQAALEKEVRRAHVARDADVTAAARHLLAQLAQPDQTLGPTNMDPGSNRGQTSPTSKIGGGERNVMAGGSISGSMIVIGDSNLVVPGQPVAGSANLEQRQDGQAQIVLLFLAANPGDTTRLRLDEEVRAIDAAMRQGAFRERFDLRSHWAVRLEDLHELLLRYRPAIVHFSGHGTAAGEIILENDARGGVAVPGTVLSELFRSFQDDLRCVVLNACFSQQQAAALAAQIDTGVGMPSALDDHTARLFAVAFYRALAYGRSVETAFELGLAQLGMSGLAQSDLPQLFGKADPAQVRLVNPVR